MEQNHHRCIVQYQIVIFVLDQTGLPVKNIRAFAYEYFFITG